MQIGSKTPEGPIIFFSILWMIPCPRPGSQTLWLNRNGSRTLQKRLALAFPCLFVCNNWNHTPYPSSPASRRGNMKSPQARILCSCKSFKRPIFSFAALLSPRRIFFSCSEIHSPSLETWALYRKSLACTSTNGWLLFAVCSSWCCKGIAKNDQLRRKSRGKKKKPGRDKNAGMSARSHGHLRA